MGWRAEERELHQKWYGGYCNNARQQGIEPLSYGEWEEQGCPRKYKKQTQRLCYIEDCNGGYFCYENEKDYFLNEKFKGCAGIVYTTGTLDDMEKEFGIGMIKPIFTKQ